MSATVWRRSWASLLPVILLGLLLAATGALLEGSPGLRLVTASVGLLLLGDALVLKKTELRLAGSQLEYQSIARRWQVELARATEVDVPSNYRLLYVTIVDESSKRYRIPILSFHTPRGVAGGLLAVLPHDRVSACALETLQAIAGGQRPDQVVRWRREPG